MKKRKGYKFKTLETVEPGWEIKAIGGMFIATHPNHPPEIYDVNGNLIMKLVDAISQNNQS